MSTRVRIEVMLEGVNYAGWRASNQLKLLAKSRGIDTTSVAKLPVWKQLVFIFSNLPYTPKSMIIVREKRNLSASRSRYIEICRSLGIGKKIKKTQPPTPVRGVPRFQTVLDTLSSSVRRIPYVPSTRTQRRPRQTGDPVGVVSYQIETPSFTPPEPTRDEFDEFPELLPNTW